MIRIVILISIFATSCKPRVDSSELKRVDADQAKVFNLSNKLADHCWGNVGKSFYGWR